jgi:multiple sugar transport system ATP-binding protein
MNFIRAQVSNSTVEIGGSKHDLSKVIGDDIKKYEGKDIIVGFRPEAISLATIEDSFNLSAEVELTELLGDNTNVYVDMNGDKVILKVDPHDTPKMDTTISYYVPHKSIYLFDAETEEVINKY